MGGPELLALSLGLSVGVAGLAWGAGRLVETLSADPRLRDRVWAAALAAPALPPVVIGLMLLTPSPVREITAAAPAAIDFPVLPLNPAIVASAAPGPMLDPATAAWAVLALAGLLALARAVGLARRARRQGRMVRGADAPDAATAGMVEAAARDLEIFPPRVSVSEAAPEALLAGVIRPRLLLPAGLAATHDPMIARAVITHELAHLRRGDHRALWIEEGLLALLAINPLMPALRARRAAAREEACDALALADAAPETRRAYAETLIEVLRSRAGPQALPALSFTGAGRRTAMRRLKAVMTPAPAAGRGSHLAAVGLAGLVAALAGAGSLAVAGEREAVARVQPAQAPAPAAHTEAPRGVGSSPQTRPSREAAARAAAEAALSSLTLEQQSRYRNPTGEAYRALCASSDPADGGFCAGVIFSQFPREGSGSGADICLPPELEQGDEAARRAALGALVERTKAEIARASVRPGDHPAEVARAALARAYSCEAAAFRAEAERMVRDFVPLIVSVDVEGRPLTVQGDETLRVVLTDENGVVLNTHGTINSGGGRASGPLGPLGMAMAPEDFPGLGESTRVYTLTGEIRGPNRVLRYAAEPATIRLAPGSRAFANLRPTLSFRPA